MPDHFPQDILPAYRSELQTIHAGVMASEHEQFSCGCEILNPFDQHTVRWLMESDHIPTTG